MENEENKEKKRMIYLPKHATFEWGTLTEFLSEYNINAVEGFCQQVPEQVKILEKYASQPGIINIMEIGFNCGHSAEVFLKAKPENLSLIHI